jgi:hypothetical protein
MFDASYSLAPSALLAAWRPDAQRLRLGAQAATRARERATVRIRLDGSAVEATVVGTVTEVRPAAGRFEVEVAPDAASLPLVRLLLAAARSQAGLVSRRPPRWLVRLPATATLRDASTVRVSTVSVSEGGCGLDWAAPPPAVGQVLRIQVGAGGLLGENRGAVCWRSPLEPTVGVQFAGRAPSAWSALVAQVARSGAPRA